MKNSIVISQILFCCFFYFGATAQYTPLESTIKLEASTQIYFAPNQYELTENSIKNLQDFLATCVITNKVEFQLQAFTDDVGLVEENEILAQHRANSVLKFLEAAGVSTTKIKLKNSEQLTLNPTKNIAEQRKEYRRVDLSFWIKQEENLSVITTDNHNFEANLDASLLSFFENIEKEYEQDFVFEAEKGAFLEGKKGTVLRIPANCLVDKNGNVAKGTIRFKLKEAYSMGDLMLQNLATVSDGAILETGGSLFLEARDADGNELAIQEGTAITASMASTAANLAEMQTFQGQTDAATGRLVNWNATQVPVQSRNRGELLFDKKEDNYFYRKSDFLKKISQLDEIPVWSKELPKEIDRPRLRIKEPRKLALVELVKPTKTAIKEKYQPYAKEGKFDYNQRITGYYNKQKESYRTLKKKNEERSKVYKKDSTTYSLAWAKYENDLKDYNIYQQDMKMVLADMYQNMNFSIWKYSSSIRNIYGELSHFEEGHISMKYVVQAIKKNTDLFEKEGVDVDVITAKLKEWASSEFKEKDYLEFKKLWQNFELYSYESNFYKRKDSEKTLNSSKHYINGLYQKIANNETLTNYELRQIRMWKTRLQDNCDFAWLTKTHNELVKKIEDGKGIMQTFATMEDYIMDLQKTFFERKNELGLLTTEEITGAFRNALTVTGLGWINCDRFYKNNEPKMNLEVVTPTTNTVIYVVFEDINAMMIMTGKNGLNFTCLNIPENQRVKLIGVRVIGQKAATFVEQGTVAELHQFKPKFDEKTLEEAAELLAAM